MRGERTGEGPEWADFPIRIRFAASALVWTAPRGRSGAAC